MYSVCIAKYPKGFPFTKAYKSVWSVIYFEPVGADKTRVSIRMLGYTDDEELQKKCASSWCAAISTRWISWQRSIGQLNKSIGKSAASNLKTATPSHSPSVPDSRAPAARSL